MRALIPALFATLVGVLPSHLAAADTAAAQEAAPESVPSDIDAEVLAAARAVDDFYQRRIQRLFAVLESPVESERVEALSHIGLLRDPSLIPSLLSWLRASKHTPSELVAATCALPTHGALAAVPALKPLLKHEEPSVRVAAMNALTRIQSIGAGDYVSVATDSEASIRASSATNLGVLAFADAAPILLKALALDGNPHVRRMCVISLGLLGDRTNGPAIASALCDANPGVRRYAAEALVKINYTPAIPNLLMAMEANVAGDHIAHCLTLMTMQDFGFQSRSDSLSRQAAIEKGFVWWTANAKDLNK